MADEPIDYSNPAGQEPEAPTAPENATHEILNKGGDVIGHIVGGNFKSASSGAGNFFGSLGIMDNEPAQLRAIPKATEINPDTHAAVHIPNAGVVGLPHSLGDDMHGIAQAIHNGFEAARRFVAPTSEEQYEQRYAGMTDEQIEAHRVKQEDEAAVVQREVARKGGVKGPTAEAIGNIAWPGVGTAGRGVREVISPPAGTTRTTGALRLSAGVGEALAPMIGIATIEAPVMMATAIIGSMGLSKAAGAGVDWVGGTPEQKALAQDAAQWVIPGVLGAAHLAGVRVVKGEGITRVEIPGKAAVEFGQTEAGRGIAVKIGDTVIGYGKPTSEAPKAQKLLSINVPGVKEPIIAPEGVADKVAKYVHDFANGIVSGTPESQRGAVGPFNSKGRKLSKERLNAPNKPENVVSDIVDAHNAVGGSTFNAVTGKNQNNSGKIAVGVQPENSVIVKGELKPEHINDFIEDNKDTLVKQSDEHSPGTWKRATDIGDEHHLDISRQVNTEKQAQDLGRENRQISLYHLKEGGKGEIPVKYPVTEALTNEHGTSDNFAQTGLIGIDGKMIPVPNYTQHDPAILSAMDKAGIKMPKLQGTGLSILQYYANDEGLVRTRFRRSAAGNELAVSAPDKIRPEQAEAIEKALASMGPHTNAYIERAVPRPGEDKFKVTDSRSLQEVKPGDATKALTDIGAYTAPKIIDSPKPMAGTAEGAKTDPTDIIAAAGGKFRGIQPGMPEAGLADHVLFDDASGVHGSTMMLPVEGLTSEAVAKKIASKRVEYGISDPKGAVDPTDLLFPIERARLGSRAIETLKKEFAALPPIEEAEAATQAGMSAADWWRRGQKLFPMLNEVMPKAFPIEYQSRFANVMGSTSPHQPVETAELEALHVWNQWMTHIIEPGVPNTEANIKKFVKVFALPGAKMSSIVASLLGQDVFAAKNRVGRGLKTASMGQALGGAENPEEAYVADTHMADLKGIEPSNRVFSSKSLYYAMAIQDRVIARHLNMDLRDVQAAQWGFKVALQEVMGETPDATPETILGRIDADTINKYKKDLLDIMRTDKDIQRYMKEEYGFTEEQFKKLHARIEAEPKETLGKSRPAGSLAKQLTPSVERLRAKYGKPVSDEPKFDFGFNATEGPLGGEEPEK